MRALIDSADLTARVRFLADRRRRGALSRSRIEATAGLGDPAARALSGVKRSIGSEAALSLLEGCELRSFACEIAAFLVAESEKRSPWPRDECEDLYGTLASALKLARGIEDEKDGSEAWRLVKEEVEEILAWAHEDWFLSSCCGPELEGRGCWDWKLFYASVAVSKLGGEAFTSARAVAKVAQEAQAYEGPFEYCRQRSQLVPYLLAEVAL